MNALTRGAISGLVGTVAMTIPLMTAHQEDLLPGEPAPKQVTSNAEEKLGVRNDLTPGEFKASWMMAHLGYGAVAGSLYALLRAPLKLFSPLPVGPLYGVLLWVAGYRGWLPKLGLYPPPSRVDDKQVAGLIGAHVIYGATVTLTYKLLGLLD